jgi:hypothetical protein
LRAQTETAQSLREPDVLHLEPNLLLRLSRRQQDVAREDSIEHRCHLTERQSGDRDGHLGGWTELETL